MQAIHTCRYMPAHTPPHTSTHTCLHTCPCAGLHACPHACLHACLHKCPHACLHTCQMAAMVASVAVFISVVSGRPWAPTTNCPTGVPVVRYHSSRRLYPNSPHTVSVRMARCGKKLQVVGTVSSVSFAPEVYRPAPASATPIAPLNVSWGALSGKLQYE